MMSSRTTRWSTAAPRDGERVVPLAEVLEVDEADIEDLFEVDFYLGLVKDSGVALERFERLIDKLNSLLSYVLLLPMCAYREHSEAFRDQVALVATYEAVSGIFGGGCVGGVIDGDCVALGDLRRPR
jgi:hypothetical protein